MIWKINSIFDNVFGDLGFYQPKIYLAKAQIAARIAAVINTRELPQKQAAEILGIDQPKISALVRGRLSSFAIDRLLRFLTDLDCDVDITIRPARQPGHGQLAVSAETERTAT